MNTLVIFVMVVTTLAVSMAGAQTVLPIQVTEVALATTEDSSELPYLILEIPLIEVPKGMRLEECIVEFYLDASRAPGKELPGETVTIEVYPFKGLTNEKLDVSRLGSSSMKRSVEIGDSRRVRLYITEFVEKTVGYSSADRRLIVGSVSGSRNAAFEARAIPGTSGAKATLTVYFSRIEDTTAGQLPSN